MSFNRTQSNLDLIHRQTPPNTIPASSIADAQVHVPGSSVRVWDKDADVDAEYWEDDTEQRDGRELADELDANEDTDEHQQQQDATVHPVTVVRVSRDVDGSKQRQRRRRHVLLSTNTLGQLSLPSLRDGKWGPASAWKAKAGRYGSFSSWSNEWVCK